jgi:hypothetical protein
MKDLKDMSAEELSKLFYHDGPTVPTKDIIAEYDRRAKLLEAIKLATQSHKYEMKSTALGRAITKLLNEADNEKD